ncbi:MAG: phosphate ABC transporter substrate-binding protein PstS [Nitrososphaerota archaeon]|nr:phosphate ABC transporter substrate-binding protein PstS [Nitrososphaerota archaeon]
MIKIKQIAAVVFVFYAFALISIPAFAAAPQDQEKITINGAGATFAAPIIRQFGHEYNNLHPNVEVQYQSIGSGGGIKEHTAKRVYFGASEAPLNHDEEKIADGTVTLPLTIGTIALAYNVPEIPTGLKITGDIIADIYLGKIKKWNDPRLVELNPFDLPDKEILVVRRSDSSGTTYAFTDYLSSVSHEWAKKHGVAKSVNWPVGIGSPGNEGVSAFIKNVEYTFGYVELAYVLKQDHKYSFVQNKEGRFIAPSIQSAKSAAALSINSLPDPSQSWSEVSLVNQAGASSYPITSFSYFLVYKDLEKVNGMSEKSAKAFVDFLHWSLTDGQEHATKLLYVPLPQEVQDINKQGLSLLKFKDQQLYKHEVIEAGGKLKEIPSWIDSVTNSRINYSDLSTEITCREGFEMLTKTSNNAPICVNPSTVDQLVKRGFARYQ